MGRHITEENGKCPCENQAPSPYHIGTCPFLEIPSRSLHHSDMVPIETLLRTLLCIVSSIYSRTSATAGGLREADCPTDMELMAVEKASGQGKLMAVEKEIERNV
jgi:hypothetical protein